MGKIIIDKTKKLNADGFSFLYEENKEAIHTRPQLLYISKSSTLPVQYKYNAFLVKLKETIKITKIIKNIKKLLIFLFFGSSYFKNSTLEFLA